VKLSLRRRNFLATTVSMVEREEAKEAAKNFLFSQILRTQPQQKQQMEPQAQQILKHVN